MEPRKPPSFLPKISRKGANASEEEEKQRKRLNAPANERNSLGLRNGGVRGNSRNKESGKAMGNSRNREETKTNGNRPKIKGTPVYERLYAQEQKIKKS